MSRTLAGRRDPIMAGGTGAGDPSVVKIHCSPVGGDVTIVAHITGR